MIDRDKDDLVPVDDPRVTAFRRWLDDADRWRTALTERNNPKAVWDEAGALIGRLQDLTFATPLPDLARYRMAMTSKATVVSHEWPSEAADQYRTLRALERGILDFGPAFLGPGSTHLAGDLALRASGSPSPLDDKIPRSHKYSDGNPAMKAAIKPQTIRFAHFMAGRNASSWRNEHAKICPKLSVDQQNVWNRLLDKAERDDCRRVGNLIQRDAPLSPEDEAIAAAAMRHNAAELADMVRAYL
jgi:hypothetical protein